MKEKSFEVMDRFENEEIVVGLSVLDDDGNLLFVFDRGLSKAERDYYKSKIKKDCEKIGINVIFRHRLAN